MLLNNSPQKGWISRWFPIPCAQQGIVFRLNVCVCLNQSGWRGASVSSSTNSKIPKPELYDLWESQAKYREPRPSLQTAWFGNAVKSVAPLLASWLNGCHILWWTEAGESEAARDEYGLIFTQTTCVCMITWLLSSCTGLFSASCQVSCRTQPCFVAIFARCKRKYCT